MATRARDFFRGPTLAAVEAIERRDEAALQRALAEGADLSAPGAQGVVPYLYFLARNDASAMARLVKLGADLTYELPRALGPSFPEHLGWVAANPDTTVLRAMLEAGLDADAQPHGDGTTLLFYTINPWNRPAFDLLLAHGASVNARDLVGRTVLHQAVLQENYRVAAYLLERGADPTIPMNSGDTPVDLLREDRSRAADGSTAAAEIDRLLALITARRR